VAPPKILVLRAGDTPPNVAADEGQFTGFIRRAADGAGRGEVSFTELDVRTDAALPDVTAFDGFVMTGSSHSVTERAPWMLRAQAYLRELVERRRPFFGICFGHQMLAEALGGEVRRNPNGREIGTITVDATLAGDEDPIFRDLPRPLRVNATHTDAVVTPPPGARHLATSALDPYAAFAVGDTARAVQFHPEFHAAVMRGYVRARAHLIDAEGLSHAEILAAVTETPDGAGILRNFVRHFVRHS
jgi:GMP synthase (glutamine-hydrolysing)